MKIRLGFVLLAAAFISCVSKMQNNSLKLSRAPLQGTWQLLKGIVIEKGDSVITDYTKNISFIKIINDTHFCLFTT